MAKKKYLVGPSRVVSKSDGDVHYISARQLMDLHGVDPRECVVIEEGQDWPRGYGPLFTEEQRRAAGLTLLTPSFHGNYGEEPAPVPPLSTPELGEG